MTQLPRNNRGFSILGLFFGLMVLVVIGGVGVYTYRHRTIVTYPNQTPKSKVIIMKISYTGNPCENGQVCNLPSSISADGIFTNHQKLTAQELGSLQTFITKTDFLKYPHLATPMCHSDADGQDEVLTFPQKYPDISFKPCELYIQPTDPAFNFIEALIRTH